jgi:peroxiredoxin
VCAAAACLQLLVSLTARILVSHLHLDSLFVRVRGLRMNIGSHVPSFTLVNHAFKEVQLPVAGKCTVIAFFPAAFSGTAAVGCECQLTVSAPH